MKKLNYVFMFAAMAFGLMSMILSLYMGISWEWQFGTIVWAFIAYINQRQIDRNEVEMKELADQMKEYLKNKK